MDMRWSGIRRSLLLALAVGLLAVPEADAKGPRGGHSGGRAARAPHVSAPRRAFKAPAYKAPRMPRAVAPAHAKAARAQPRANNNTQTRATNAQSRTSGAAATAAVNRAATSAGAHTMRTKPIRPSPNTYTYGQGSGARSYRAYGYGRGYRNHSYGGRNGYGRSQGNNRAIVARLRSVHASLARIDQDYKGHRVRAMHAISMAIRQLTHRSMVYQGRGFAAGVNNGLAMGMRRGGGAGAGRRQPMTRAQSDARMSQAQRTLQGIHMQLTSQGYHTAGHARARGHVQHAIHELNTALSIR